MEVCVCGGGERESRELGQEVTEKKVNHGAVVQ
jgi:hypothetical protein